MAKKNPFKSKSFQAALDRYIRNDPDQQEGYEETLADYDVARKIYELPVQSRLFATGACQTYRNDRVGHLSA